MISSRSVVRSVADAIAVENLCTSCRSSSSRTRIARDNVDVIMDRQERYGLRHGDDLNGDDERTRNGRD